MNLSQPADTRAATPHIDVDAYLQRIAYTGTLTPDLNTLTDIIYRHTLTIPFENLNPYLRYPVLLNSDALQHKIVRNRRGGYCFEQNMLLSHILQTLGFEVTNLTARAMWNRSENNPQPRTHMLLHIAIDDQPYIVDVGFGGISLTGVLHLEPDIEQTTPHEPFRVLHRGGLYELQVKVRDGWKPMYCFDLQPQLLADYEMANWYVSNHPDSQFVNGIIVALPYADRRYTLRNTNLSTHYLEGESEHHTITSLTELRDTLEGTFGIMLPQDPQVHSALARLL